VATIDNILLERPSKHGEFTENSRATWEIMRSLQRERNWATLKDEQRHALYMIAHKMARIVAGDPNEHDHWDDIMGYASCVVTRLRKPVKPYDGNDIYSALAVGWNVPIDVARSRVQELLMQRRQESNGAHSRSAELPAEGRLSKLPGDLPTRRNGGENYRPNTPEDGGHHAAYSEEQFRDN